MKAIYIFIASIICNAASWMSPPPANGVLSVAGITLCIVGWVIFLDLDKKK